MSLRVTISLCFSIVYSVYFSVAMPQEQPLNETEVSGLSRKNLPRLDPDYTYPQSYRDMTYTKLSENAQELFYAMKIHPSCVAKKGQCIPRGKCIEKAMLYISRVCYTRDLVCCYLNVITNLEVEHITKYPQVPKTS